MVRCDGQGVNRGHWSGSRASRGVALAHHYREFEGLSIRQIAGRLGRSSATVKAYFYDPAGGKLLVWQS